MMSAASVDFWLHPGGQRWYLMIPMSVFWAESDTLEYFHTMNTI